jgi:DNA polymerase sigma
MPPTPGATPNRATSRIKPDESNGTEARTPAAKEAPPAKRTWTRFEEQPGRVTVNGFDGSDPALVLYFGPRHELTATWSLPLDYLNQCRPGCTSLDQALEGLTVGLFRRGCVENGVQASIISKQVLSCPDFGIDKPAGAVRGKVPFFSPRTPGHVLFRVYWERDPTRTLAMGPTLHIRVLEKDFDSSVRFILSNFKGKKSNPTSLSSLNTLAQVLETRISIPNESAARALFGCVQEARKVIEACAAEYQKVTSKLAILEESIAELKRKAEEEDAKSPDISVLSLEDAEDDDQGLSEVQASLREKMRSLMSGRASCERKWRDSQLAFASILKSAVTNQSLNILLRRDMLARMRLEYSLWCPLCEEFAVPTELAKMWYEPLRDLPQAVTADDFQQYAQARAKMEARTLGFEPNTSSLEDILFPRNRSSQNQNAMDARAVNVFNVMSTAMGQWYQELFKDEDRVVHQREMIRERTEKCVQDCGAFPPGTRVVIFGSSANGFGSPKSDIDMCLQLPHELPSKDDENAGFTAMSKLADHLATSGMNDVDSCRLTARIPVIKFYCPNPLAADNTQEAIECDLSMHNPLAVLNTALLRTYAEITPVTRVLASIVKRWAKARDINNPARHTLSSYGYIIMLLHYMTYHRRTGNGLVTPVAPPEGDPRLRQQPGQPSPPLLPNLQWMDPMWPNFPRGTPYRDVASLPRNIIRHPMEEGKTVNSYFYRPSTPNDKALLQMLFPDQDLSLAILLASFFRYYAFEFDYKRFVVSLHSTASRGLVEREVKAELDGWRHYSASLTVEDPFETFYDVAHVLRGGYYHRIRREFAVAYTKIADAASGRQTSNWPNKELRSLSGQELIDWICEPVANDRDQTQADPS